MYLRCNVLQSVRNTFVVYIAIQGCQGVGRPGLVGDRELLECAKGTMPRCLSPATSRARTDIVLDEGADARPGIIPADELECLVVAEMAGEGMIVLVAEDTEPEIARVGDVDAVIEEE